MWTLFVCAKLLQKQTNELSLLNIFLLALPFFVARTIDLKSLTITLPPFLLQSKLSKYKDLHLKVGAPHDRKVRF